MPIQKYYVQSEKKYFHHSQYYNRDIGRYETENETTLGQLVIEEIFDCFGENVTVSDRLVIGKHPRQGETYKEDYDSQAWYPVVYEVYVLDSSKIKNNKTPTNNVVIHRVYFGSETPIRFYPNTYLEIMKKHDQSVIQGIKALFHDYVKPQFFSLHCRHHAPHAREIFTKLPDDLDEAYAYLLNQRTIVLNASDTNTKGSMVHRINFAIAQIANELQRLELSRKEYPSPVQGIVIY